MDLNGVLQTVLRHRGQGNFSIKPKQKEALQNIVLNNRDCLIVLPTGYGKSLIYQLLPPLFDCLGQKNSPKDESSIVIVVSPLNALIDDQINKLKLAGVSCASLRVLCGEEADERFEELEAGKFQLIFTHPEVAVSNRKCREIFLSTYYQRNVVAVVIDEAHCIIEWGHDFRKDYGNLGTLSSVFPSARIVAMTATATREYQRVIIENLNMKNPSLVIANPNRANIFYEVLPRPSYVKQRNVNQFEEVLSPIAEELIANNVHMPVTIIYSSLELCGVGFAFLERKLGEKQFYPPGAPRHPQNRLFTQFHSPQTDRMKSELLSSIVSESCTQRVIFATVAFGMGIDSPLIERVIHFGVPRTMESFFQESGRAGRDGRPAKSTLYFNNHDVAANVEGLQPIMREYCKNPKNECRRKIILQHFGFAVPTAQEKAHRCCDVCQSHCSCSECKVHENAIDPSEDAEDTVNMALPESQIQEIRSRLVKFKEKIEAKENYFQLSMCSGLTMEVIDELCLALSKVKSLDQIFETVPVWRKEHAEQILEIIRHVMSHPENI